MNKLNSKRKHKMMNKLKKNRKKQKARDQPLRNLFMSNLFMSSLFMDQFMVQFMAQCMVQCMNQSKDLFNRKMKIRKKFKLISLTTKLLFITKAKNH